MYEYVYIYLYTHMFGRSTVEDNLNRDPCSKEYQRGPQAVAVPCRNRKPNDVLDPIYP